MKRIDSVNARPNVNGTGKNGFHDNADLEGQDATYLTPEFMNMIQEELANLLEKNGEDLDPNSNAQLYKILATKAGLTEFLKQAEILLKQQDENNELAIKDVLDKLKKLSEEIASMYPRLIAAGVISGNTNMIDLSSIIRDDLRDGKYIIQITPESSHEAWSITRANKSFTYNVFNRSETNRINYNGNVNWSVIQQSADSQIIPGEMLYTEGEANILLIPNQAKKIILVGAGGGGGAGVHQDQYNSSVFGGNGGVTRISIGDILLAEAGGGLGGKAGWWDNGSAWSAGAAGLGGTIELGTSYGLVDVIQNAGNSGTSDRYNKVGGTTVSPRDNYGAGGNGGDGRGNNDDGWAGGGGSGAYVEFYYKNTTTSNQTLSLVVGAAGLGGKGSTEGRTGKNGVGGVVIVRNDDR